MLFPFFSAYPCSSSLSQRFIGVEEKKNFFNAFDTNYASLDIAVNKYHIAYWNTLLATDTTTGMLLFAQMDQDMLTLHFSDIKSYKYQGISYKPSAIISEIPDYDSKYLGGREPKLISFFKHKILNIPKIVFERCILTLYTEDVA